MAKKFQILRDKMTDDQRAEASTLAMDLLSEMPIHELRQAMRLSQAQIAETLNVNQAAVSKMENRADMLLSTLRRYVEAVGGELEIRAYFREGNVKITGLGEIDALSDSVGTRNTQVEKRSNHTSVGRTRAVYSR